MAIGSLLPQLLLLLKQKFREVGENRLELLHPIRQFLHLLKMLLLLLPLLLLRRGFGESSTKPCCKSTVGRFVRLASTRFPSGFPNRIFFRFGSVVSR